MLEILECWLHMVYHVPFPPRVAMMVLLLTCLDQTWLIENPGSSCLLLHPWLGWAIKLIQKASGKDALLNFENKVWTLVFKTLHNLGLKIKWIHWFWSKGFWIIPIHGPAIHQGLLHKVLDAPLLLSDYEAHHGHHQQPGLCLFGLGTCEGIEKAKGSPNHQKVQGCCW